MKDLRGSGTCAKKFQKP